MTAAQDVANELSGAKQGDDDHHAAVMFAGGPTTLQHTARSIQDKVTHAAKEITLFLPGRELTSDELKKLAKEPTRKDTNLGHSINAAAYGRVNYEILSRIAKKLGVNIEDVK